MKKFYNWWFKMFGSSYADFEKEVEINKNPYPSEVWSEDREYQLCIRSRKYGSRFYNDEEVDPTGRWKTEVDKDGNCRLSIEVLRDIGGIKKIAWKAEHYLHIKTLPIVTINECGRS